MGSEISSLPLVLASLACSHFDGFKRHMEIEEEACRLKAVVSPQDAHPVRIAVSKHYLDSGDLLQAMKDVHLLYISGELK